jgi:hypothetical protein
LAVAEVVRSGLVWGVKGIVGQQAVELAVLNAGCRGIGEIQFLSRNKRSKLIGRFRKFKIWANERSVYKY